MPKRDPQLLGAAWNGRGNISISVAYRGLAGEPVDFIEATPEEALRFASLLLVQVDRAMRAR